MKNPNNKSEIAKNDNIKTLIAEGNNIAKFLKERDRTEFNRSKGMLNVDVSPSEMFDFDLTLAKQEKKLGNDYKAKPVGVWFRLGFLAHQISKGVCDKNSIGLRSVDKRRISEAKIFWENQTECLAIHKASKKGFSSLSALIKAFNASKKVITEDTSTEDTSSSEAKQSDVGQTTEGNKATPTLPKSAKEVLELLKVTCDRSNILLSEVLELLLEEEANKLKETSKGSFQVIGKTVIHDNKLAVNDCPF